MSLQFTRKDEDEDEDEDEDDGCRHACVPTPYYRLFRAETQRLGAGFARKCQMLKCQMLNSQWQP